MSQINITGICLLEDWSFLIGIVKIERDKFCCPSAQMYLVMGNIPQLLITVGIYNTSKVSLTILQKRLGLGGVCTVVFSLVYTFNRGFTVNFISSLLPKLNFISVIC